VAGERPRPIRVQMPRLLTTIDVALVRSVLLRLSRPERVAIIVSEGVSFAEE
jgi:hypothetical protein